MANKLVQQLSKRFFWDLNYNTMDDEEHKRIIIERVFTIGDIDDVKKLINTYDNDSIVHEIKNVGYLDKKTINWLSLVFKVSKSDFKCYTKTQSNQVHWNF